MTKVITYGTFDFLHYGHIRLLKRARELGDYLIVGVTANDYDRARGKINVQQSLEERIAAVRATGIADKIIVESYEGQKIDDIKKYDVDIFTVGSDWDGQFDYLNEFCKVVYLPRTDGVSSSEIRSENTSIKLGLVGYSSFLNKFYEESKFVNTVNVVALCSDDTSKVSSLVDRIPLVTNSYQEMLKTVDAVYIHSHPQLHYEQCKNALLQKKHVLCESPISMRTEQCDELFSIADQNGCILMEAIRTAYMTAYSRLQLLIKGGIIGRAISVDSTCTSLRIYDNFSEKSIKWGSMETWGPTALLPVFQLLGTEYSKTDYFTLMEKNGQRNDAFTKINIQFPETTATIKVGTGVKSEGELVISGTDGYAYIPAPWWKTDYFEIRFEDPSLNKRYFYQVDGEGIRYELVALSHAIKGGKPDYYIGRSITRAISSIMGEFIEISCNDSNTRI